jgi:prevent-host-death family protein
VGSGKTPLNDHLTSQLTLCDNAFKMSHKKVGAKSVGISEFKAKALRMIDETARKGTEYVITKKGKPVARVIPLASSHPSLKGSMKGLIEIRGDIVEFDSTSLWEAAEE